jgi:hypothetical protein
MRVRVVVRDSFASGLLGEGGRGRSWSLRRPNCSTTWGRVLQQWKLGVDVDLAVSGTRKRACDWAACEAEIERA